VEDRRVRKRQETARCTVASNARMFAHFAGSRICSCNCSAPLVISSGHVDAIFEDKRVRYTIFCPSLHGSKSFATHLRETHTPGVND